MAPDTHRSFSDTLCVYCKPVHTSLFRVELRMTTKLACLMIVHYTAKDDITLNNASFYKTKLASYPTHCSVFSISHVQYL